MSKAQDLQRIIAYYVEVTGNTQFAIPDVVDFAVKKLGFQLPVARDPKDLAADQFAKAARQQTKINEKTGLPFRVYHAVTERENGKQLTLWHNIDGATRKQMDKSLQQRRDQMVGDACQLAFDADRWNYMNPSESPIMPVLDFTDDVEERKAATELPDAEAAE